MRSSAEIGQGARRADLPPPRQKVYYNGLVEFAPVGDLPAVWRNLSRPESSLGCILVPLPSAAPLVTDCHWLAEDRR